MTKSSLLGLMLTAAFATAAFGQDQFVWQCPPSVYKNFGDTLMNGSPLGGGSVGVKINFLGVGASEWDMRAKLYASHGPGTHEFAVATSSWEFGADEGTSNHFFYLSGYMDETWNGGGGVEKEEDCDYMRIVVEAELVGGMGGVFTVFEHTFDDIPATEGNIFGIINEGQSMEDATDPEDIWLSYRIRNTKNVGTPNNETVMFRVESEKYDENGDWTGDWDYRDLFAGSVWPNPGLGAQGWFRKKLNDVPRNSAGGVRLRWYAFYYDAMNDEVPLGSDYEYVEFE